MTGREASDLVFYVERGWLVVLLPEELARLERHEWLSDHLSRYRISQWVRGVPLAPGWR